MHTYLRKIGNSKGIIIPTAFLESCSLSDAVDLRIEGKTLVIKPLNKPRAGWFDGYKEEADDGLWNDMLADDINEEWEW
ncbi:AbrB family transcriptional regulator [Methylococcaceae bacterium CS1]|nr:AbrB family transcriptional regulator [Methylococcaceae bacterium CS5]TXK98267.1 AbrB family transcriptional regulator [Methylococcaceae bacterium CS4]TXL06295.1 AbrB family transcriptional regulator [Methylococcaceae bacterium CS3]TXL07294.1 AbrB family transcriptional regulator [Methylococcaceae bacterium CS1]TXL11168.1 AbrB family transcriptional regulator [Methylococcaceae bacterium CS2]